MTNPPSDPFSGWSERPGGYAQQPVSPPYGGGPQPPNGGQPPQWPGPQPGQWPNQPGQPGRWPNQPGQPGQWPNQPGPTTRRRRPGLIAGAILAVLLVGGGLGLYFGLSSNNGSALARSDGGASSLGDLSTLDPCSLTTADTFAYLDADVQIQPSGFNTCHLDVEYRKLFNGLQIDITPSAGIDPSKVDPTQYAVSTSGRWHVIKQQKTSAISDCAEVVYLADKNSVVINTSLTNGGMTAPVGIDLCGVADHAATGAMSAVDNHTTQHLQYPKDSVEGVNLCAPVTAADVSSALRLPGVTASPSPATHSCTWQSGTGSDAPGISLDVKLTPPATVSNFGLNQSSAIAGHTSFTMPGDAGGKSAFCSITTTVKVWKPWPGRMAYGHLQQVRTSSGWIATPDSGIAEEVELIAETNNPAPTSPQLCAGLTTVAQKIWATLPTSP